MVVARCRVRDRSKVRRFVRPSLRGGLLLSVCLSVCLLYWQNFCLRTWTAILEYLPFPYARQYNYGGPTSVTPSRRSSASTAHDAIPLSHLWMGFRPQALLFSGSRPTCRPPRSAMPHPSRYPSARSSTSPIRASELTCASRGRRQTQAAAQALASRSEDAGSSRTRVLARRGARQAGKLRRADPVREPDVRPRAGDCGRRRVLGVGAGHAF